MIIACFDDFFGKIPILDHAGWKLDWWVFLTSGGGTTALRRFAGGELLRLDWKFCGERFFMALPDRAGMSGLAEFLLASCVWRA